MTQHDDAKLIEQLIDVMLETKIQEHTTLFDYVGVEKADAIELGIGLENGQWHGYSDIRHDQMLDALKAVLRPGFKAALAAVIAERDSNWQLAEYERHEANDWHAKWEAMRAERDELRAALEPSATMIEAGEMAILQSVGGADLGGYFSAEELAASVYRAMEAARASRPKEPTSYPGFEPLQ